MVAAGALLLAGCTPGDSSGDPELELQEGGDYLVDWWSLRGSLAGDQEARDEVAAVVADYRTPEGEASHPEASALLWLGEADGVRLAVVDFRPEGDPDRSWLLELAGESGSVAVTGARRFDGPVLNEHILPVRSVAGGPRYLASEQIVTLTAEFGGGPAEELPLTDGLTGPVALPACRVTGLAGGEHRRLDLGPDLPEPFYPLLAEGFAAMPAAPLLAGVDTCAALAPDGWLGTVGEPDGQPAVRIGDLPALRRLGAEPVPGLAGDDPPGQLLTVHAEYVSVSGGVRLAEWLLWTYPEDTVTGVQVEPAAEPLVEAPGLLVAAAPEQPLEISYTEDGAERRVTVPAG